MRNYGALRLRRDLGCDLCRDLGRDRDRSL